MSETENALAPAPVENLGAALGGRLAHERQVQNLSTTDVARQLKLSVRQVEALEAGQYQRLPGPVFVRGFIRNYARLLRLDPEPLLQSAGESLPQQAPHAEMLPSQDIPFPSAPTRRWPRYAIATALVVIGLALYEFYWSETEPVVSRPVALAPAPPQLQDSAPDSPAAQTESDSADRAAASELRPGEPRMTASAATVTAIHDPALQAAGAMREDRRPQPGERQVRFIFDEESWVDLRDRNGKTILYQLNRPGTEQRVSGLPPLTLIVGNARGVRLSYDDKPVDLARHTKVDVARLTLE
jgi:cytoskeleton protein RodZ